MSKMKKKLEKITANVGVGKVIKDTKHIAAVEENLMKITGQKPARRMAKKAIAGFKLRQGDLVGLVVTLRGKRMNDFLTRLIKLTLPSNRDFKGINESSIDATGNLTVGLADMTAFPELHDQAGSFEHGIEVTLVSSAPREKAKAFYESLGIPFKK